MTYNRLRGRASRGFTLIELLVVIAIIAILAAILFPVFAKAREAARGASSQSNLRQQALGILMYVQDYDETYPLFNRWGPVGSPGFPISYGSVYYSMWGYDILPYIKTQAIFVDPLSGPINQDPFWFPYYSQYGYDYTALSPANGATDANGYWIETPATLASVARPSELVMLGGKYGPNDGGQYWYGAGTIVTAGGLEAPDCSTIVPWCFTDWVPNGNFSFLKDEVAGLYTGGVSLRKALNANLAFTDGHVKFMQAGTAAVGTNWFKGILAGAVQITTPNKYMFEAAP